MDEGRKRTLAVIAAIFLCRKLAAVDGRPSPARMVAFEDSINLAEELIRRVDERWPAKQAPSKDVNTAYKYPAARGGRCYVLQSHSGSFSAGVRPLARTS
jgi:hypothetical protein